MQKGLFSVATLGDLNLQWIEAAVHQCVLFFIFGRYLLSAIMTLLLVKCLHPWCITSNLCLHSGWLLIRVLPLIPQMGVVFSCRFLTTLMFSTFRNQFICHLAQKDFSLFDFFCLFSSRLLKEWILVTGVRRTTNENILMFKHHRHLCVPPSLYGERKWCSLL